MHRTLLADAVGAVGRLVFDRRVPPRVEQEHVIGGGEVEAGAARLERGEQHRRARADWKLGDHGRRDRASSRRGARSRMPRRLQVRLDEIEQAGPLREDQRLVPLGGELLERFEQRFDLGRGRRALAGHERGVTRRLAQAQQRLERGEHAAAGLELGRPRRGAPPRAPRDRARARSGVELDSSTTSVRGGSSGATSRFNRRSTKGAILSRSRASRCLVALARSAVA